MGRQETRHGRDQQGRAAQRAADMAASSSRGRRRRHLRHPHPCSPLRQHRHRPARLRCGQQAAG